MYIFLYIKKIYIYIYATLIVYQSPRRSYLPFWRRPETRRPRCHRGWLVSKVDMLSIVLREAVSWRRRKLAGVPARNP